MEAPSAVATAVAAPAESAEYKFYQLQNLKFSGLSKKSTVDSLKKWGIYEGLRVQGYSFDAPYRQYLQGRFVQDFFKDPHVCSTFEAVSRDGSSKLGAPDSPAPITAQEVSCKATSMALFDKLLADRSTVYEGQAAPIKLYPEVSFEPPNGGDVLVLENELKKMIVRARGDGDRLDEDDYDYCGCDSSEDEEHEKKHDYAEEYSEFIFRLFGHLVLGGTLCQSDDCARPYLDVTKLLYKDLISVSGAERQGGGDAGADANAAECAELVVNSVVLQINADFVFAKPQYNNFLYLIIDTRKNICYTLYNQILG